MHRGIAELHREYIVNRILCETPWFISVDLCVTNLIMFIGKI